MTTILAVFLVALLIGLMATPVAAKLGRRLGAMDVPGVRKVHKTPIPRAGGAAIFFTVVATLVISSFFMTEVSRLLVVTRATVFLFLGAAAFILVRKVGYFEYFSSDKIYGWLRDVTDVAGLSHDRRSFLSLQNDMTHARTCEDLFDHLKDMVRMLDFDMAEFEIRGVSNKGHFSWHRKDFDPDTDICRDCLLKLELPLLEEQNGTVGTLWLIKDLKKNNVSHYTLRRVEHLRRTLNATLLKLTAHAPPFAPRP